MKKKLSEAAWKKLSEEMQALYKLVGKDYVLQVEEEEEDDEPGAAAGTPQAKLALERKHRKAAEKARDEAVAALEELQAEKETTTNDSVKVKTAHDKKVAKLEGERDAALLKFSNYLGDKLVGDAANEIAGKLTKSPKIMLPHIQARLQVNHEGDEPTLVILDAKGKPSTATLEDLTKEFRDNKDFAGIVTASQASGGGASRPGVTAPAGSAPVPGRTPETTTDLNKLKGNDLVAAIKARREQRDAASAA